MPIVAVIPSKRLSGVAAFQENRCHAATYLKIDAVLSLVTHISHKEAHFTNMLYCQLTINLCSIINEWQSGKFNKLKKKMLLCNDVSFSPDLNKMTFNARWWSISFPIPWGSVNLHLWLCWHIHPTHMSYHGKRRKGANYCLQFSKKPFLFMEITQIFIVSFSENMKKSNRIQFWQISIGKRHQRFWPQRHLQSQNEYRYRHGSNNYSPVPLSYVENNQRWWTSLLGRAITFLKFTLKWKMP